MPEIKIKYYSYYELPHSYQPSRKQYHLTVGVKDIPKNLEEWRSINPRDPKTTSPVFKAILDSLENKPQLFFDKNRGLSILADKDYNQNTKIVEGKESTEPLTIVAEAMEQDFTIARFKQAKIIGKEKLNLTIALKQLENKQEHCLVVRIFTAKNLDHSLINRLATAIDNGTISN